MSENIYTMVFDAINIIRIAILGDLNYTTPPYIREMVKYGREEDFGQVSS
jgi:hypothetical protein